MLLAGGDCPTVNGTPRTRGTPITRQTAQRSGLVQKIWGRKLHIWCNDGALLPLTGELGGRVISYGTTTWGRTITNGSTSTQFSKTCRTSPLTGTVTC